MVPQPVRRLRALDPEWGRGSGPWEGALQHQLGGPEKVLRLLQTLVSASVSWGLSCRGY